MMLLVTYIMTLLMQYKLIQNVQILPILSEKNINVSKVKQKNQR